REIAATWLALGLNTDNVVFYPQSDVPEIPQLAWLLSCVAAKGLLNRAHAYKDAVQKKQKDGQNPDYGITMDLFRYPVLMAADLRGVQGLAHSRPRLQGCGAEDSGRGRGSGLRHHHGPVQLPGVDGRGYSHVRRYPGDGRAGPDPAYRDGPGYGAAFQLPLRRALRAARGGGG